MTLGCFAALAKLQEDFGFGYFVVGYCEGIRSSMYCCWHWDVANCNQDLVHFSRIPAFYMLFDTPSAHLWMLTFNILFHHSRLSLIWCRAGSVFINFQHVQLCWKLSMLSLGEYKALYWHFIHWGTDNFEAGRQLSLEMYHWRCVLGQSLLGILSPLHDLTCSAMPCWSCGHPVCRLIQVSSH